jgi:fructose-specific phosphotransferase system IIA component
MKQISEIISTDHIVLDLDVKDKFDAISVLIKTLGSSDHVVDQAQFARDLIQREKDFPTGLENGTALPHARTTAVTDLIMAFARCKHGVDFGAPDSKPAHLIFLFGVPRDEVRNYLKTIAQLSRLLQQERFRNGLMRARNAKEIISEVSQSERRLNNPLGKK